MWNVVAPAGSEDAVVAAVEYVESKHPDLDEIDLSRRVAALVPGARVGPLAMQHRDDGTYVSVGVWLTTERFLLLRQIADLSTVHENVADVVLGMLDPQIDMVYDEMKFGPGWEQEALRYSGGMTPAETEAYDAAQRQPDR